LLGFFVISPEIRLGGFLFQPGKGFLFVLQVKDNSAGYPAFGGVPEASA